MDFFSRGYAAIRGEKGQPQEADETIEKLADCLETATLLEDRRAGVLGLKGLVRHWPEEVGNKSLPGLIKVLHTDSKDVDVTKSVLETLSILCMVDSPEVKEHRGYRFTDHFIEDSTNVTLLLDILEEFDFYERFNTIKLLSILLANRSKRIQECILTSPMGITRLVDLLDDKRDIIRNESLLLLISLTHNDAEVQKLVTFQATFEKLLLVIEEQEGISGDIVVQDSLTLMHNLLRYNVSDQVYFRETSCIQHIPGLLGYVGDSDADHVPFSYEDWPTQKVANTVLVLELIRILTEPDGSNTPLNQKVMVQSGILLPIVQLGICSNAPAIVRTEALHSLAYVIRNNAVNQNLVSKIRVAPPPKMVERKVDPRVAPSSPRPALMSLVCIATMSDLHQQYSYSSRGAAASVVSACAEKNPETQMAIASIMNIVQEENTTQPSTESPLGSLLLEIIGDWEISLTDPYKVWFACTIFSQLINDHPTVKRRAGEITLGDEANGEEPIPLLHHIVAQVLMATQVPTTPSQIPIAYLSLLCTWLFNSPESVSLFLSESTHVQFLIQQVQSSSNDPVVQGLTSFLLGITYEFNSDPNTPMNREKLQTILSSRVDQFCSQITRLKDSPAIKNAKQYFELSPEEEEMADSHEYFPNLLLENTFVEFFKETYESIQRSIKKKPASFMAKKSYAQAASDAFVHNELEQAFKITLEKQASDIKQLEDQVTDLTASYALMQTQAEEYKEKIAQLEASLVAEKTKSDAMEKEQEDLLVCMGEQDLEIKNYRRRLRDLGQDVAESEDEGEGEE
ncbi:p115 like vesicle tethering protein [Spinellus fusiger]|nr:p115 like vesicle tethering protein [Spinellus fusiger]